MTWNLDEPDSDTWHVIPVNDHIEHEDHDCPCGTEVEIIPRDGLPDAYIYAHRALDGRELIERGETIPTEGPDDDGVG